MDNLCHLLKERAPKCDILRLALDLTTKEACESLVQKHIDHHKKLDTLVLNHGVQEVQEEFEDLSSETWLNTFDVNIHGHFYISKAALPHLKEGSTITMNASVNHFKGHPKLIDYTATKGAMVGFCRALSNALVSKRGIRCNGAFVSRFDFC